MFLMEGILEDVLIVTGPVFVFIAFATKELPNLKCVGTRTLPVLFYAEKLCLFIKLCTGKQKNFKTTFLRRLCNTGNWYTLSKRLLRQNVSFFLSDFCFFSMFSGSEIRQPSRGCFLYRL